MMLFFAILAMTTVSVSDASLLETLRKNYEASSKSEKICNQMLKSIPASCSNTEKGYKGALLMMKAAYAWMPTDKLNYFNQGKALLEEAIRKEPSNVELRYIRFSVQESVPSFLGYDHRKEDRTFLENQLPLIKDVSLKNMIRTYLTHH